MQDWKSGESAKGMRAELEKLYPKTPPLPILRFTKRKACSYLAIARDGKDSK